MNISRIKSLEEELSAEKRKSLTEAAENAVAVAALTAAWGEENATSLAAQTEVAELKKELDANKKAKTSSGELAGVLPDDWTAKIQELVTFLESQEGKGFKAAFAAGDDDAKDLVLALAVKPVTDMVAKVPYGQVDLVGRLLDCIGGLVMDALKDRLEEGGQTQSAPPTPEPEPSVSQRVPLKKGKARRQKRHGPLEELADMAAEGELRLRRA